MTVLFCLLVTGCKALPNKLADKTEFDRFTELDSLYESADNQKLLQDSQTAQESKRISLQSKGITLENFSRWLAQEVGITLVIDQKLAETSVAIDATEQAAEELIILVARQIGKGVAQFGTAYYIGDLGDRDVGLLTAKIGGISEDKITDLVKSVGTTICKVSVIYGGITTISDQYEGLRRISQLIDYINSVRPDTWVVQLYLARTEDAEERDLSAGAELEASYKLARASESGATSSLNYLSEGWLSVRGSKRYSDVKHAPLLMLMDGQESNLHSGRTVPIPKRTISDSGYSVVEGYEKVKDGLQLTATIFGAQDDTGLLDLNLTQSTITGYVESSPILREDTLTTKIRIASGGVYLIGSLRMAEDTDDEKGFFRFGKSKGKSSARLDIWARVYKL